MIKRDVKCKSLGVYISHSAVGSRYAGDGLTSTDARFTLRVGTGTEELLSVSAGKAYA